MRQTLGKVTVGDAKQFRQYQITCLAIVKLHTFGTLCALWAFLSLVGQLKQNYLINHLARSATHAYTEGTNLEERRFCTLGRAGTNACAETLSSWLKVWLVIPVCARSYRSPLQLCVYRAGLFVVLGGLREGCGCGCGCGCAARGCAAERHVLRQTPEGQHQVLDQRP